ncbi:hypothetical protein HELRODRAFT_170575 [Helobdella robusta]|uniref:Uncharacterized protein n=1 Tax=Helobdella robusta TaxID=6412 RepID=T1F372_HELRO|nr:hypothetical protein HELRODRAFT_170575 [Helobdella robusta]ESO07250.1 hypothetical protein HELRODRAFT_170575 [Helobdella robusta]
MASNEREPPCYESLAAATVSSLANEYSRTIDGVYAPSNQQQQPQQNADNFQTGPKKQQQQQQNQPNEPYYLPLDQATSSTAAQFSNYESLKPPSYEETITGGPNLLPQQLPQQPQPFQNATAPLYQASPYNLPLNPQNLSNQSASTVHVTPVYFVVQRNSEPPIQFTTAYVLSVLVLFFCFFLFGTVALVLTAAFTPHDLSTHCMEYGRNFAFEPGVGQNSWTNGSNTAAKRLRRASYAFSILGILAGIALILYIILSTTVFSKKPSYN